MSRKATVANVKAGQQLASTGMSSASGDATTANPLVSHRAPRRIPRIHARLHGQHFIPNREDVINASGALNIYPGDFTYRPDPALEIDFGLWEDSGQLKTVSEGMSMTMTKGYNVALASDFEVSARIQMAWKADVAGRLTFGGLAGGMHSPTMVLMWRTGQKHDQLREANRELQQSNNIQQSVEQKMAESTATMSERTGEKIRSTVTYEDDMEESIDRADD